MRNAYLEDLSVGQRFVSGSMQLGEDDIIRFARDYDPQPFHLDPALAAETLFGGLAASGWHTSLRPTLRFSSKPSRTSRPATKTCAARRRRPAHEHEHSCAD